jgi:regulatory protein
LRSAIADILSRSAVPTEPSAPVQAQPAGERFADRTSTTASAYDAALRLLGVRARSEAELRKRLHDKDFPPDEIQSVMTRLGAAGLLDDADFAEQWVHSRHRHSGKGRTALRHELRQKGVADTLIERALDQVDDDAERERAADLLRRKTGRLCAADVADRAQRDKQIRRLVAMLARRGYSPSLAMNLVTTRLDELSAD